MPIDVNTERLVALRDLPSRLPLRRGKRVNVSTIYRWISRGARGRVLESIQLGGRTYTSLEALERFARPSSATEHINKDPVGEGRMASAESELDAFGIG